MALHNIVRSFDELSVATATIINARRNKSRPGHAVCTRCGRRQRWLIQGLGETGAQMQGNRHVAFVYVRRRAKYGYVGGLGWDLETAVDDAVIAIRDAMRVGTLASIHTAFWADKL